MKEATGELNMTVVTIVAIAALVGFFYLVIWPTLKIGMSLTSACSTYGSTGGTVTFEDGSYIECAAASATSEANCSYHADATDTTGQTKICK